MSSLAQGSDCGAERMEMDAAQSSELQSVPILFLINVNVLAQYSPLPFSAPHSVHGAHHNNLRDVVTEVWG